MKPGYQGKPRPSQGEVDALKAEIQKLKDKEGLTRMDTKASSTDSRTASEYETASRHTPGPWTVGPCENNESPSELWINAPNGDPVVGYTSWRGLASVYGCDEPGNNTAANAQMAANAQLIAAAPELLAAAKLIASFAVSWEPLSPGDIRQLTAAIAKAEGR